MNLTLFQKKEKERKKYMYICQPKRPGSYASKVHAKHSTEGRFILLLTFYRSLARSFFSLDAPSNNPRSTAAATVKVPPTIAQSPDKKPRNVLARSSRLMTFMGEISWTHIISLPSLTNCLCTVNTYVGEKDTGDTIPCVQSFGVAFLCVVAAH